MDKSMYQTNISDTAVYNAVMTLAEKHHNAIPIFGGALHIDGDLGKLVACIPSIIHDAKFFKWHEDMPTTIRRFCHLCFVDPALVEAYIGMTFEQLVGV